MEHRKYIEFLNIIEKLKCNTRHSWTSSGRHESVAEHSWRLAVMAMLCADEYSDLDMNKVIKMCLIHDFGEAITGDIPEMKAMNTDEAKLFKSLDNIEAMISHNEADISTWLPREYEENLSYGQKNAEWSEWTKRLREVIKQDSIDKINRRQIKD